MYIVVSVNYRYWTPQECQKNSVTIESNTLRRNSNPPVFISTILFRYTISGNFRGVQAINPKVHAGQQVAFVYILPRIKFVKRLTIFLTRKLNFTWVEIPVFHMVFLEIWACHYVAFWRRNLEYFK